MIRAILMLTFWGLALPLASLVGVPWTYITRDIRFLYWMAMKGAWVGIRIAGAQVETKGLDRLDPKRTYIFMSNHTSNLDPPLLLPLLPGRTSVMTKQELFRYPILGEIMRMGSLVPVDRGNREAGIAAVRTSAEVIRRGLNMTIYAEGKRSFDGRLLPFKKGPFYLALECGVAVVPITITGTHEMMPKGRFRIRPGKVGVIFHPPIEPSEFGSRDRLMKRVWETINAGLPSEYQGVYPEEVTNAT